MVYGREGEGEGLVLLARSITEAPYDPLGR